ncbi:MAG: hypothetical protein IJF97_00765 [Eggerthellaceae bacterium]|nr:hypothetical protein [Eggerthellaceae bacterium]MBQ3342676.1 hypothetical protein [Kiritimatiellia bacterium]
MDWTKSGIYNRYGVEFVDVRNVDKSLGWFTGKVVGGTITEDYRSEYRVSASLEIDGGTIPVNRAVRIWHVAELDGEEYREELGTFWPEPADMSYDHGRYHGTVELHSAMKRLGTDLRCGNGSVAKDSVLVEKFALYVKNSGGVSRILTGVSKTKKLAKDHAWAHGESVLTECQRLADALGAWIGVDTHGRVTLEPYVNPSKRSKSFDVPKGASSMTEVGTVGYERQEIYNRFIASYENSVKVQKEVGTYTSNVKYTENVFASDGRTIIHHQGDLKHAKGDTKYKTQTVKKSYFEKLDVPETHQWHHSKIGRLCVFDCGSPTISVEDGETVTESQVKSELAKMLKTARTEHADTHKVWSATMLYMPKVKMGAVGTFYYQDNPDADPIQKKVFVSQREITLDTAMRMELTLEEI